MALTIDETVKATHEFLNEYNYNFPLKFNVVEKPEDIYNKDQLEKLYEQNNDRDRRQIGFDGAYHPASGRVVLISSSLRDTEHAARTLRHEVVGHYGINTLNEQEKRQLLTSISNSRDESTLKPIWAKVDSLYKDSPESIKAEEVFAFVAEKHSPNSKQYASDKTPQSILQGKASITLHDLEHIVNSIEHEIKLGVREQQVFPKTDQSQFKLKEINMSEENQKQEETLPEEPKQIQLESFKGTAYINEKDELIIDTKDDREIMFGGVKAFNDFAQEEKLSEKDTAAVYELLENSPSAQREIQQFEDEYLKEQAEIAHANSLNPENNQELLAENRSIEMAEEIGIASATSELDQVTKERLASMRAADRELVEKQQSENAIEPIAIEVQKADTPNQNSNENDNQVSSDEILTPEDDKKTKYVLPQDIEQSYLKVGNKYYTKNKTDEPAFVDKGNKLETTANSDKVAESLVRIASARGWNEIKVTGTEKFRRDVWLEAATRGMEIKGYSPTEQDKVALAARVGEIDKQNIAPENKDFRAREKEKELKNPAANAMRNDPLQAAKEHPELAPALAGMEAIKKQNQARNLSPEAQRIINARVHENVINSIERGHSFDTKLNEEKILERDQEKEKEVTR